MEGVKKEKDESLILDAYIESVILKVWLQIFEDSRLATHNKTHFLHEGDEYYPVDFRGCNCEWDEVLIILEYFESKGYLSFIVRKGDGGIREYAIHIIKVFGDSDSSPKDKLGKLDLLGEFTEDIRKGMFSLENVNPFVDRIDTLSDPIQMIGNLWYHEEIGMLFATRNVGKSILAVQIAYAISRGEPLNLGSKVVLPNNAGALKVVFFDFELSDTQSKLRIHKDEGNENLFIAKPNDNFSSGTAEQMIDEMKFTADSAGAKVIIIDNLSGIGTGFEESDKAIQLLYLLREMKMKEKYSILIVNHTPKGIKNESILDMDNMSGSGKFSDFIDTSFGMKRTLGEDGKEGAYIKHLKARNGTKTFDGGNVIVVEIVENLHGKPVCKAIATMTESDAIAGASVDTSYTERLRAVLLTEYLGSQLKAAEAEDVTTGTISKRVSKLKINDKKIYGVITKCNKEQLKERLISAGYIFPTESSDEPSF